MRCFRSEWLIGAVCLACAVMAPAVAADGDQQAAISSDDLVALVQAGIRARQQSIDELIVYMLSARRYQEADGSGSPARVLQFGFWGNRAGWREDVRRVSADGSAEPVERSLHYAGRTDRITFESATSVGTGEGDGLTPSAPWLLDIGQWGAEAQWSAYVLGAPRPQAERVQYAGEDCVLLRWEPASGGEARAWIAPAKSFLVVRRESRTPADRDGYKERIYNVVLDAVAEPTKGVWLPWRYRMLNGWVRSDSTIDWRTMDRIEATHIRVNPNQEGIAFQYGALPGARVYFSGAEGNTPIYGGDPTPLVAALQVPWDPVAQIAPCERIEVIAEPGSRGNW